MLKSNDRFYCVDDGIWFESAQATGPWQVSIAVPEGVEDIPPSSPAYNVKYVYVYDHTPDVVYVGYTPGLLLVISLLRVNYLWDRLVLQTLVLLLLLSQTGNLWNLEYTITPGPDGVSHSVSVMAGSAFPFIQEAIMVGGAQVAIDMAIGMDTTTAIDMAIGRAVSMAPGQTGPLPCLAGDQVP